jgi:hypothetical protein
MDQVYHNIKKMNAGSTAYVIVDNLVIIIVVFGLLVN